MASHEKDAEISACNAKLAVQEATAAITKTEDTTTPKKTLATVFEE